MQAHDNPNYAMQRQFIERGRGIPTQDFAMSNDTNPDTNLAAYSPEIFHRKLFHFLLSPVA
ncbi:MAG: hypothetical protein K0R28_176, partial [Paenibacillus sp.]|nr:hypothetical protein [Paenibacillus sp.]